MRSFGLAVGLAFTFTVFLCCGLCNQYDKRSSGPREVPPSVWLEDDSVYMYTRAVDHLFVCILYCIICTVSFVRAETAWHAAAAQAVMCAI